MRVEAITTSTNMPYGTETQEEELTETQEEELTETQEEELNDTPILIVEKQSLMARYQFRRQYFSDPTTEAEKKENKNYSLVYDYSYNAFKDRQKNNILSTLPLEILIVICGYLSPLDLQRVTKICRLLILLRTRAPYAYTKDCDFWKVVRPINVSRQKRDEFCDVLERYACTGLNSYYLEYPNDYRTRLFASCSFFYAFLNT